MEYTYKILDKVYYWMLSKQKNIEVRLLNEKSKKIQVGDFITFINIEHEEKFIKVKIEIIAKDGGNIEFSNRTKRKVLAKHSYLLMCDALKVSPSIKIDINDNGIPKHCGMGSSSSTIAAVAAAINELYGCPIDNQDLIKYLASNHGEEVSNDNPDSLKVVQCIGGGATNGLSDEGIIIISGRAGTGKTLLALDLYNHYVDNDKKVIYLTPFKVNNLVSSELKQKVKMRTVRSFLTSIKKHYLDNKCCRFKFFHVFIITLPTKY